MKILILKEFFKSSKEIYHLEQLINLLQLQMEQELPYLMPPIQVVS